MIAIKRTRQHYTALMFGLSLFFGIGLVDLIRAEEAIISREKVGPDAFGRAVDISGDTLIVGAPAKENGEVYIFARQERAWVQLARIKAPQPNPGGWFGGAVCVDGDTIVVGARTAHGGTQGFADGTNVVYIYQREGNDFPLKQKLTRENKRKGERFGFSLDMSGDTLVVGSPFHGDGGASLGVAYVYVREEEGFQLQRRFFGGVVERFGWSVGIDGDTIVVGAPASSGDEGRAAIYVRQEKRWKRQAELWLMRVRERRGFGWSVAISGDRVIIGAPFDQEQEGAAYAFARKNGEWTDPLKLKASNTDDMAMFGYVVDIHSDWAVIGAPFEHSVDDSAGAVYFFQRDHDMWDEKMKFTPKGVVPNEDHKIWQGDAYGYAVAIAEIGPYAAIGAPGDNLRLPHPNPSGAVYVYHPEKEFSKAHSVEPISLKATTLGDVKRTVLFQNFPNPFNPETWIPYQLAVEADVNITIYDVQGRQVRLIELGRQSAGAYFDKETAAYWDGRNDDGELVTSGVYYYHLRVGDYHATRRMVIVK